jgi:transcriptional regulator with XRE-family HTH domain
MHATAYAGRVTQVPGLARVRQWRVLTLRQLADLSGVAVPTLIRLEHGGDARPVTVQKLARALNVSVHELTETDPERPPRPE